MGRQHIPRPLAWRLGGDPPWASIPADRRRRIALDRVRAALDRIGPSQPWGRAGPLELREGSLPAAVLVALFEEGGEAHVVLTRRSSNLRAHTGEVSFPGGRLDPGEEPVSAALREATEEVGLDPSGAEIIGELAPLATFASRSFITPFVAVLPGRPQLHPNPAEVELAFDVTLARLLDDDVYHAELWQFPDGIDRELHFFELGEDTVWGATARMLRDLLDLVVEEL